MFKISNYNFFKIIEFVFKREVVTQNNSEFVIEKKNTKLCSKNSLVHYMTKNSIQAFFTFSPGGILVK